MFDALAAGSIMEHGGYENDQYKMLGGSSYGNTFAQIAGMQAARQSGAGNLISMYDMSFRCKETSYGDNASLNRKLEKSKEWLKSRNKP